MKTILISVICASIILAGCGRNGTELTKSDDVEMKRSSSFSLNHKKANKKTTEILRTKSSVDTSVVITPIKTGSRSEYTPTEDISAGPEFDKLTTEGHWAGTYHDYQSNTLKVSNVNLKDRTFHFSLILVTSKECVGEIHGKAKIINETPQAQYIQDPQMGPCEIIFEFDKHRSIYIKEVTCMDAAGNQCIFEGDYQK